MNKVTRGLASVLALLTLVLPLCTALADDGAKLTVINPEDDPDGHSTATLLVLDSSVSEDTVYKIKVSIPDRTWNQSTATDTDATNFSFGDNISGINGLRVSNSQYQESEDEQWVELVVSTRPKKDETTLEPGVYIDPMLTVYGETFISDKDGENGSAGSAGNEEMEYKVSGITFVIGPCVWYNNAEAVVNGDSCELKLYLVGNGLSFNFNDQPTAGLFSVSADSGYEVDNVAYESEKELTVTLKTVDGRQIVDTDLSGLNLCMTDKDNMIKSDGEAGIDGLEVLYVNHEEPEDEDPNSNDGYGQIKNHDGDAGDNDARGEKNPEEIEQSTDNTPVGGTEPDDDSDIDTVPDETNPDDTVGTDDELSIDGEDSGVDHSGTDKNDTSAEDDTGTDNRATDSDDSNKSKESGEFPLVPVIIGVVIAVCVAAIAAAVVIILRKKDREQKLETINNSESVLARLKTETDVEDITMAFNVDYNMNQSQTQIPVKKSAEQVQRPLETLKSGQTFPMAANMPTTAPIMEKTQATIRPAVKETKTEMSALPELQIASFTNVGKRESQQDSKDYRMLPDGVLAVVADGMGGLTDGDKVSKCVVTSMLKDVESLRPGQLNGVLRTLILRANDDVNQMLGPDKIYRSGSTMVAVLVRDGYFHWASIGDSRIYLYRDGNALQVNQEHTYEVELFNRASNGEIPYEAIKKDPQRRGLTSFFGMGQLKYVDMSNRPIKLKHGDRILLLTDGVFNRIPEDALAEIIRKNEDVNKLAETLEKEVLALNDPVQDNFTAIVIAI